jgi:Protein of unknown function (DUF2817)
MTGDPEAHFPRDYRDARKAFISACGKARVDTISRVHPKAMGPDGKSLFMDSAALGPRDAKKAVLVVGDGAAASAAMTDLLTGGIALPEGTRLVLVHAFDPFAFAGMPGDRIWSTAMLRAVATEDLAQVSDLSVFTLGVADDNLAQILAEQRPRMRLESKQMAAETSSATLRKTVTSELARL